MEQRQRETAHVSHSYSKQRKHRLRQRGAQELGVPGTLQLAHLYPPQHLHVAHPGPQHDYTAKKTLYTHNGFMGIKTQLMEHKAHNVTGLGQTNQLRDRF